jgi:hypothetical protein
VISDIFPWYDSGWLSNYVRAKQLIQTEYPDKYADFVNKFQPLRTNLDFQTIKIDRLFDRAIIIEIQNLITKLQQAEIEQHEIFRFGRLVVHDLDYFNQLQAKITPLVSELVGEPVEPSYNFLSLYNNLGVCRVHMDAPYAKYTLDACIEQSHPWPIYFSQVQAWPENFEHRDDWERAILTDPHNTFTEWELSAGEAVIFSGSSQWHYRQRIPQQLERNFCHLIFFHFMPCGMSGTIDPDNWAKIFDLPELDRVIFTTVNSRKITTNFEVFDR